jgi:serine/threonine-protein kinase HipA
MFRLDDDEAHVVLREVSNATSAWRLVAADAGLSAAEIERMASAFDHEQAERARKLVSSAQA